MKKNNLFLLAALLTAACLTAGGCGSGSGSPAGGSNTTNNSSAAGDSNAASDSSAADDSNAASDSSGTTESSGTSETTDDQAVAAFARKLEGLTPVPASDIRDGVYSVEVESSSSMFRVTDCRLTVKDGTMTAAMTMSGTGYLYVYPGTGQEAEAAAGGETDPAAVRDYIPFTEAADGSHVFEIPVEALDQGVPCAAFSKKRETWYDRILVFRSSSLPQDAFLNQAAAESPELEDGLYTAEVSLEGGSGRASVESPALLRVEDGQIWATIVWGSSNYDYMKVKDERYELLDTDGNSSFEIPVEGFDRKLPVLADTMAMGQPHEIEYTLTFDSSSIQKLQKEETAPHHSLELSYATQFSIDYYENGRAMITIADSGRYLLIPAGDAAPDDLPEDVTVIRKAPKNIYLCATSAMDLFRSLDAVDKIRLSGTTADGWYIEEAKEALNNGSMLYAGKYSAPDYERLLAEHCDLAIESTMIYHTPEVKEQLELLGIPVLVERSSYESNPLGRMEWLKLYGAILDQDQLAEDIFQQQVKQLEPILNQPATGKTAAFFYIGANGAVNVRKSGDYIPKMIEMAGGTYVPSGVTDDENALSTMNMEMEAFYETARDADCIIYSSTIDGELSSLEDLISKSPLLADFKAVKNGQVWCTRKTLFQETSGLGDAILDIHRILTEQDPPDSAMKYLYRLK